MELALSILLLHEARDCPWSPMAEPPRSSWRHSADPCRSPSFWDRLLQSMPVARRAEQPADAVPKHQSKVSLRVPGQRTRSKILGRECRISFTAVLVHDHCACISNQNLVRIRRRWNHQLLTHLCRLPCAQCVHQSIRHTFCIASTHRRSRGTLPLAPVELRWASACRFHSQQGKRSTSAYLRHWRGTVSLLSDQRWPAVFRFHHDVQGVSIDTYAGALTSAAEATHAGTLPPGAVRESTAFQKE